MKTRDYLKLSEEDRLVFHATEELRKSIDSEIKRMFEEPSLVIDCLKIPNKKENKEIKYYSKRRNIMNEEKEQQQEQKKIKLNEQLLTESEFQKEKERVENMKGAKLVEVAPGEYKIQLFD